MGDRYIHDRQVIVRHVHHYHGGSSLPPPSGGDPEGGGCGMAVAVIASIAVLGVSIWLFGWWGILVWFIVWGIIAGIVSKVTGME
jgi:hypothetical protein